MGGAEERYTVTAIGGAAAPGAATILSGGGQNAAVCLGL